ncbi:hypothetical protein B0H19DRAFT_879082, partial [Mycena capillaripes]
FPRHPISTPPLPTAHPAPSACPDFTVEHVLRAIGKISPWKAPGLLGVPNGAIRAVPGTLAPILLEILLAGLHLGYFPDSWHVFITATLHKPGKDDYTLPGTFHPIAEEEGLGKIPESVIADWLSGFTEANGLLSANQFGG